LNPRVRNARVARNNTRRRTRPLNALNMPSPRTRRGTRILVCGRTRTPDRPWDFRRSEPTQLSFDKSYERIQRAANYTGPVRGNEYTRIYEWPGCPYYDLISESSRVDFVNARKAQEAGYRPAHDCP
jgi:hypothetical protein